MDKIFLVRWKTGGIRVEVGNFFGNARATEINKLLKLARIYCTSKQQADLLMDLEEAMQERLKVISGTGFDERFIQMRKFLINGLSLRNSEKAIKNQCDNIAACIRKIKAQTWGQKC